MRVASCGHVHCDLSCARRCVLGVVASSPHDAVPAVSISKEEEVELSEEVLATPHAGTSDVCGVGRCIAQTLHAETILVGDDKGVTAGR